MKKLILVFAIILTVFGTVYFAKSRQAFSKDFEKSKVRGIGEERTTFIKEFEPDDSVIAVSPPKSLENLRGFLNYIFSSSPNLFFNAKEQNKWLSADLQKTLKNHL